MFRGRSLVTIITLPPKCHELNPVENVWQFLRDNWLSNRVIKSYADLVDHCCEAWNKLVDQPCESCPSVCANGHTGSDQWDLVLVVSPSAIVRHRGVSLGDWLILFTAMLISKDFCEFGP